MRISSTTISIPISEAMPAVTELKPGTGAHARTFIGTFLISTDMQLQPPGTQAAITPRRTLFLRAAGGVAASFKTLRIYSMLMDPDARGAVICAVMLVRNFTTFEIRSSTAATRQSTFGASLVRITDQTSLKMYFLLMVSCPLRIPSSGNG